MHNECSSCHSYSVSLLLKLRPSTSLDCPSLIQLLASDSRQSVQLGSRNCNVLGSRAVNKSNLGRLDPLQATSHTASGVFCYGDLSSSLFPYAVYCNLCSAYMCSHSPYAVVANNAFKLIYPADVIANSILPVGGSTMDATVSWKAVSYNIETLHEASCKSLVSPDRTAFCDFLTTHAVHFAALQEPRSTDQTRVLPGFVVVSSGADSHGNHGAEIWLTSDPFPVNMGNRSTSVKIDHNKTIAVHKEPRLLLVSFELCSVTFYILNTHGPHRLFSKHDRIAYWTHVFDILCKTVTNWRNLLWLGDFNLSFGQTQSSAVGSAWPFRDRSTSVSDFIHAFLTDKNLSVPATFPEYGNGDPLHTYVHSTGSFHMLDHILVHRDNMLYGCTSFVTDYPSSARDHRCVFLQATFFVHDLKNSKPNSYDSQKFGVSENSVNFTAELHCASFNAPFLNSTMQLHYYNTYLHHSLCTHFPVDKAPRRNLHISDHTRQLMHDRDITRSHLKFASRSSSPNFVILHWHTAFKKCVSSVRFSLKSDSKSRVNSLCKDAAFSAGKGQWKSVYKIVRMLCPSKRTPLCSIKDNNVTYSTFSEIKGAFVRYFSGILGGTEIDLTELVKSLGSKVEPSSPLFVDICSTVSDLMKGKGKHSAPGSDGLKYCVYYAFPFLINKLRPVLESANCCCPPLQWLVDIIHPLFKGKGSPHICPSYRDILLANCGGKLFKQGPRNALLPHLNTFALDSMCGGILAKGTDFCSHYVRAAKSLSKQRGTSLCILFVDVHCAFASVLRDLVFHNRISDSALASFFSSLGCDQSLFGEFIVIVRSLSAMDTANVPVPLQDLVASLAGQSFFTMRGSTKFVDYINGTGAGNPLADILFNFLIARVLRHIDHRLHDRNLHYIDSNSHHNNFFDICLDSFTPFSSTSYFDDGAFFIEHPDPQGCIDKSIAVSAIVVDSFVLHGFRLNFKVGKTACMFRFRGTASRAVHNSIYGLATPAIPVFTRTLGLLYISACLLYIHMGSKISYDESGYHESKSRADSSSAAFKDTQVLCKNRNFTTFSSLTVTRTLCFSRLSYNIGSCWDWNTKATNTFDICYFKMFRRVFIKRSPDGLVQHISNDQLCNKYMLTPPDFVRLKFRLRYFRRLLLKGPVTLWALLLTEFEVGPKSFLLCILGDLQYLWSRLYVYRNFPDPALDFKPWKSLILDLPTTFLNSIDNQALTESQRPPAPPPPPSTAPLIFVCHKCGSKKGCKHELSAHLWISHGIKIPLRSKVDTTHCLACLTQFHTRTKLLAHISYRCKSCAYFYDHHVDVLDSHCTDPLEAQETIDNKALRRQGKGILFHPLKSYRLRGPKPYNSFHFLEHPPT